jgi:hypothetical protein
VHEKIGQRSESAEKETSCSLSLSNEHVSMKQELDLRCIHIIIIISLFF